MTLTRREREVLALIGLGAEDKLIAKAMGISINTVKSHKQSVFRKMRVNNRTQAALKGATNAIHDEIAKLPKWPKPYAHALRGSELHAVRARLALAREWIETTHAHEHGCEAHYWTDPGAVCTCGRDALLAALEPPK